MITRIPLFVLALLSAVGLWIWVSSEPVPPEQQVKGLRATLEETRRLFDPAEWLLQPEQSSASALTAFDDENGSTRLVATAGYPEVVSEFTHGTFAYFTAEAGVWKLWRQSVEAPQPEFVVATRQRPTRVIVRPDRDVILYAVASAGQSGERYFWLRGGSTDVREVATEVTDLAVSTDGRYLVYSRSSQLIFREFRQNSTLSEPLILAEGVFRSPMFDQSGESLIVLEKQDSNWSLIELNWRTLERRVVLSWPDISPEDQMNCALSPDDIRAVCAIGRWTDQKPFDIRLVDLETGHELAGGILGWSPRWMSENQVAFHLVTSVNDQPGVELWSMDASGNNRERVAGAAGWLVGSERLPSGRTEGE